MEKPKLTKSQQKAVDEGKLVETVNSLSLMDFMSKYFKPKEQTQAGSDIDTKTGRSIYVDFLFSCHLKSQRKDMFKACFDLICESSSADYAASEVKWSPANKRKEMLLPDMRYLILYEKDRTVDEDEDIDKAMAAEKIWGFISFMTTYEDGLEVLYVYEIHLDKDLRGQGVGTILMSLVEGIGRKIGLEKCMLTVFNSNKSAVKWYKRIGYSVDDFSPGPRVLRNGTVKQPTYSILSKSLRET